MLLACRRGGGGLLAPGAVVAWAAFALDLADGLFSYMKSDLLVAVLPIVLIGFDRAHASPSRASLMSRFAPPVAAGVLIVYFFLFVVSTYSPTRRRDFREGTDPYSVPVTPYLTEALLAGIPGTADFRDAHRFPNGVWGLIGRMSMTPYPAWAYRQVESAGFRGLGFFEELLTNVTPRVLWPDKPVVSPGRDFSVTIGVAANFDSARSATALTMQGAYYWRGGYVWLVLGCALSGAAFAVSWLLFRNQNILNPASTVVVIMLCHEGFRWFESAFVGGFPMYIYLLVVFLPAQVVLRHAVGYRVSRPPRRSEA